MGIVDSALAPKFYRALPRHECFNRKILLLRSPKESSIDNEVHRALASMAVYKEYRLLRSIILSVSKWSGEKLLPEQWQTFLVGNSAVVYFFSPETDIDPAAITSNMEQLLNHALVASHGVEVFTVCLGRAGPNESDYRRASESYKARFEIIRNGRDVFTLLSRVVRKIPPLELQRPLRGLLSEVATAVSATEAHIIDAASLFPMISYTVPGVASTKAIDVVAWHLQVLLMKRDAEISTFVFNHANARILLSWVCRPCALIAVCVSDPSVGNELVHRNMLQISYHVANVINNTSRIHRFMPIVERDEPFGDNDDE